MNRSPRRGMCAAILSLEAITLGLSTPVLLTLTDVSVPVGLAVGLGPAGFALLLAGALRSEGAYRAGGVLQGIAISLGVLVPMMFFLGAVFGLLWGTADLLGRKIDRRTGLLMRRLGRTGHARTAATSRSRARSSSSSVQPPKPTTRPVRSEARV